MTYSLIEPPSAEPVSLIEAKNYLRIDQNDEDALIGTLIVSARLWAENYTRRAFVSQKYRFSFDEWDVENGLPLPCDPVLSVEAVTLFGAADEAFDVPLSSLYLAAGQPRVFLRDASVLINATRVKDRIQICATCGFGGASSVPEGIKLAIKQLVAHWYHHRGEAQETVAQPPLIIYALLQPFRRMGECS